MGFSYWVKIVEAKYLPKTSKYRKTITGRALYVPYCFFQPFAWTYLYPFGLYRCARTKIVGMLEEKSQEVYISGMRGATLNG